MYFVRIFLIGLIIYLLVRSFMSMGGQGGDQGQRQEPRQAPKKPKGVPKQIGEYVDYEEVEKEK